MLNAPKISRNLKDYVCRKQVNSILISLLTKREEMPFYSCDQESKGNGYLAKIWNTADESPTFKNQ